MKLPKDILILNNAFKRNGKKLYIVGGAVRDFILGVEPKDYDLATDALPDETIDIVKDLGFNIVEVGKSFGVVVVGDYEIASFRADVGSGRRPDYVEFTTIDNDVKRRDLTINALFYDIDKNKVVDLVGGVEDIKNRVIRTVGSPVERFDEDPLRKLRALRFVSLFDGDLDEETYKALKNDPSLNGISFERIRDEFLKSISKAKSVKKYFELLDELNFWDKIFPNLEINKDFVEDKDYIVLIALLLKDNNQKTIDKDLKNLKYNIDEVRKIKLLISLYNFVIDDILFLKKQQEISGITDEQIKKFAKYAGVNLNKFLKFQPSVSFEDVPKDLKGKEISNWILQQEKNKFSLLKEFKNILSEKLKQS